MGRIRNKKPESRVKWTEGDERPYVTAVDLINSESFKRAMNGPEGRRKNAEETKTPQRRRHLEINFILNTVRD